MSIGIALMEKLVEIAAQSFGDTIDIEVVEKHHRDKKDAPSGTAVALGRAIARIQQREYNNIARIGRKTDSPRKPNEITFHSVRGGGIVGEHSVFFLGKNETIEISHIALSRELFVDGVINAVRFMVENSLTPGLYSVKDIVSKK